MQSNSPEECNKYIRQLDVKQGKGNIMNDTNTQANQAENIGTEVQGNEPETTGKKMFTQDEVNGFVQNRISRMKGQIEKEVKGQYEQKLAELNAREMKVLIKEKLSERKMPRELADIITCSDEEDINDKLNALQKIYGNNKKDEPQQSGFRFGAEINGNQVQSVDPVRKAMGLD